MMIHEITAKAGAYKAKKRLGRGRGSGHGKTSGRGHKGAGSRAGYSARHQFEGGQMPFFRRMQRHGFSNVRFGVQFWTVNIGDMLDHPELSKGGAITKAKLVEAGLIRDESRPLKVLGGLKGHEGLKVKYDITAERVTGSVKKMVTDAGGSVTELGTRRDQIRGVDRASGDPTPKNLTWKRKRLELSARKKAEHAAGGKGEGKAKEGKKSKKG
ncbi:MAG: 50S ribosomal protein L15 [Phycisphaerales bacterium]|nr:50S ribosomal protein L15 [Phycisphaerales bacterium]